LPVEHCAGCGSNLKHVPSTVDTRQEFELPVPKIQVIEYQAEIKNCKKCGCETQACFPDHITHTTQYGARAKSLMVYMNQYQLLPFKRASEFFKTVYGHNVSPATIANATNALSTRMGQVENEIKELLKQSELNHCDETGVNINGDRNWMHTIGNDKLTHYAVHKNRGSKATKDIGILPEFKGIMVHDHWKSYFQYSENQHALCNAHHLRELRFLYEYQNIKWAKCISDLLVEINDKKEIISKNNGEFSKYRLKKYSKTYDDILSKAAKEQARRGTIDSRNLLKRLKNYKNETLLFMNNMLVPFTNNLSERDLRMNKVKQKISGCFRKANGVNNFCKIRSVISTAKKNSVNIFDVLTEAFQKIISVDLLLKTAE